MCVQVFPNASLSSEAADEPLTVKVVTTAEQLQAAVAGAARHIELRSHLDLTSLDRTERYVIGNVSAATLTLRVCPHAPVHTATVPPAPGRYTYGESRYLLLCNHAIPQTHGHYAASDRVHRLITHGRRV